jgi:hypothetical protein
VFAVATNLTSDITVQYGTLTFPVYSKIESVRCTWARARSQTSHSKDLAALAREGESLAESPGEGERPTHRAHAAPWRGAGGGPSRRVPAGGHPPVCEASWSLRYLVLGIPGPIPAPDNPTLGSVATGARAGPSGFISGGG